MNTQTREGRYCDPKVVRDQIGLMTVLGVSGGRWHSLRDKDGETVGIALPCGTNRTVEVVLNFLDLYTVRRYRTIVNGARKGETVVEYEAQDIYCDQLSEVVYSASCWR